MGTLTALLEQAPQANSKLDGAIAVGYLSLLSLQLLKLLKGSLEQD
jgi:hypothetical protein